VAEAALAAGPTVHGCCDSPTASTGKHVIVVDQLLQCLLVSIGSMALEERLAIPEQAQLSEL
ncbi:MAG: hypothetical protein ACI9TP_001564, partial [Candidatus Azotimanducaceae bacterium]